MTGARESETIGAIGSTSLSKVYKKKNIIYKKLFFGKVITIRIFYIGVAVVH